MLLCGERDKIRLKKNPCCPTWLGPASIAAVSCLQLVLRAQGTNVSTVSTETSCPDTFSWFSLVISLKDKESIVHKKSHAFHVMVILLACAVEKLPLNKMIISFAFITFNAILVVNAMSVTSSRSSRCVNCKAQGFQCHSDK